MPQKVLHVNEVGSVAFYKRRGSKSVKIRISGSDIRVSMPQWMPYKAAAMYVESKAHWINRHRQAKPLLTHGQAIGKRHKLKIEFTKVSRVSTKITTDSILVKIPESKLLESQDIQEKIEKAAKRTLLIESEELIIPRARELAARYDYHVSTISIKQLRSRWGSCSSTNEIVFSLYLIQLPRDLIDYVIYHELAHTVHMNHSKEFWDEVSKHIPAYKTLRAQLKNYSPHVRIA